MATRAQLELRAQGLQNRIRIASNEFSDLESRFNCDISNAHRRLKDVMSSASKETLMLLSPAQGAGSDTRLLTESDINDIIQNFNDSRAELLLNSLEGVSGQTALAVNGRNLTMLLKQQNTFEKIVKSMDAIIESTGSLQQLHMSCGKQAIEFENRHLGPTLHRDISMLLHEVNLLKIEVNRTLQRKGRDLDVATRRRSTVQSEMTQNRYIIQSNEGDLNRKKMERDTAQRNMEEARQQQFEYQRRAAAARQSASNTRTAGILIGIFTLGIGLPVTVAALISADNDDERANEYAAEAMGLEREAENLSSSCRNLESSIDSLRRTNASLENEETVLSREIQALEREQASLTNAMNNLNLELEKLAFGVTSDITNLESSVRALEGDSKELRDSMQRAKINMSQWRNLFVKYRDASEFAAREAKRRVKYTEISEKRRLESAPRSKSEMQLSKPNPQSTVSGRLSRPAPNITPKVAQSKPASRGVFSRVSKYIKNFGHRENK